MALLPVVANDDEDADDETDGIVGTDAGADEAVPIDGMVLLGTVASVGEERAECAVKFAANDGLNSWTAFSMAACR